MIRVNLLPAELEVAPSQINPGIPVVLLVALLAAFLVPDYFRQIGKLKHQQTEVTSLTSELERYQPILAQIEQLETAKAALTQRKNVIQTLETERLRYPQFMEDFVKLLPGNIWLTTMGTTSPPGGNTMTVNMDVVALDNYAIADLISNLETSEMFADVSLGAISMSPSGPTGQTMNFRVTATYKKGARISDASKKS
jgi:Tfp pilus assembly protein PilN